MYNVRFIKEKLVEGCQYCNDTNYIQFYVLIAKWFSARSLASLQALQLVAGASRLSLSDVHFDSSLSWRNSFLRHGSCSLAGHVHVVGSCSH